MANILLNFAKALDKSCAYTEKSDKIAEQAHMAIAHFNNDDFLERLSKADQEHLVEALNYLSDAREMLGKAYWELEKVAGR